MAKQDRFTRGFGAAVTDIRHKFEEVFYGRVVTERSFGESADARDTVEKTFYSRTTTERFLGHFTEAEIQQSRRSGGDHSHEADRSPAEQLGWDIDR